MKVLILQGSPNRDGNTSAIASHFSKRLLELGCQAASIFLRDKNIGACTGCYACQQVQGEYGCIQKDDAEEIFSCVAAADVTIFAAPIYSWYCPAEMKALMDRHYGLNKYYGSASGQLIPSMKVGLITTHGYPDAYANEPFEMGIQRLCKHCHWDYVGRYSVRDIHGKEDMFTEEAISGAIAFAEKIAFL